MIFWDKQHHDFEAWVSISGAKLNRVLSLSPSMLRVLQIKLGVSLLVSLKKCRRFVARSPTFSRIFLARLLLFSHAELNCPWPSPYQLRLLLGVSWDDVRMALSAVRSMIDRISRERIVDVTITILALVLGLYPRQLVQPDQCLGLWISASYSAKRASSCSSVFTMAQGLPKQMMCSYLLTTLQRLPHPPSELTERWQDGPSQRNLLSQAMDLANQLARAIQEAVLGPYEGQHSHAWLVSWLEIKRRLSKFTQEVTDEELERNWQKQSKWKVSFTDPPLRLEEWGELQGPGRLLESSFEYSTARPSQLSGLEESSAASVWMARSWRGARCAVVARLINWSRFPWTMRKQRSQS
ncbi:hypothetical protein B0H14DRAFT_2614974 [Mycena olivaceomarginata]|nr:hypothetical protein B0H14DRAFT_2614974 [Mycena olivaceomarginata]